MTLSHTRLRPATRKGGFTLLELIVVITIIGLLGSIVVVKVAGLGVEGRKTRARADMQNIYNVAEAINTVRGVYPETIQEMVNATKEDGSPEISALQTYPRDPWNNDYNYEIVNGRPQVTCYGSDKSPGGAEGEAKDLLYPEPEEGM